MLLQRFAVVRQAYDGLPTDSQTTIADITARMAGGMGEYAGKDRLASLEEYNDYCQLVAGLVGEGLTHMFVDSALESEALLGMMPHAHAMGQFLQKVNIIRDIYEDMPAGRCYWPAPHTPAPDDTDEERLVKLEAMVQDAMALHETSVAYLAKLEHPGIFRFCAIPQAMALATLARIRHNPAVFDTKVKLSRADMACIFMGIHDMASFRQVTAKLAAPPWPVRDMVAWAAVSALAWWLCG